MEKLNYDFTGLILAMDDFKRSQSQSSLNGLKKEINKFFKGSSCIDIIYTKNTDKMFFGMCVMPRISNDKVTDILTSDEKIRINEFLLEIDSKLLDPVLNLSKFELVAILLHEIGHVVNDSTPIEEVRNSVTSYLTKNRETLILSDAIQYKQILLYGIKDTIRKTSSLFCRRDEEIIADEFVVRCGFGQYLETAYKKISKNSFKINSEVSNKFMVFAWVLRIYKDVRARRIYAIHTLNKGKESTASQLEKREIDNMIRRLKQIDDDMLIKESANVFKKTNEYYKNIRYKGMRSLEDELYEYNIRVKNVDEQDEALMILRQINTRISIIDDYIKTDRELDEKDKDRWFNLMEKYMILRDTLSKKSTYVDKYYGLFIPTPEIRSRYEI